MIVLLHVLIAFSGVLSSGFAYLSPSKSKLRASYVLVMLTIASGTYLVIKTHSPLVPACMTGLAYIGLCLFGIISARHKLSRQLSTAAKANQD